MIRPQVRSQIRPPILPQRHKLSEAISRYFTRPDASAAQYYQLSSSVSLSNDFEIEHLVSARDADGADGYRPLGWVDNDNFIKQFDVSSSSFSGQLRMKAGGFPAVVFGDVSQHLINGLNKYRFLKVGSDITAWVNDNEISTQTIIGDFVFDRFGQGNNVNFLDGILADLKVWHGGDRNTGALIIDFPFGKPVPADGIIPNGAAGNPGAPSHITAVNLLPSDSVRYEKTGNDWYGPELLDFGDWVFGSYSTYSAIDGVIYIDTIGAGVESVVIHSPLGLISKFKTYLVEYDVISTDGSIRINHNADGQTNEVANPSEGRRIVEVVGNGLGDGRIQVRVAANTVAQIRISNFSIREILRTAS